MPIRAITRKDELDRFYTDDCIAIRCVENGSEYIGRASYIVEPSAGGGAFVRAIDKVLPGIPVIAYDIAPSSDLVVKANWFDVNLNGYGSIAVVGNPPFGRRSELAKQFIRHAIKHEDVFVIAMILPDVWSKATLQSEFPPAWHLASEYKLPNESFWLNEERYHVLSVFQVWTTDPVDNDLRWPLKPRVTTEDFRFCDKDEASFFVLGASPSRIINVDSVLPTQRGYYIVASSEKLGYVKDRFRSIPWNRYGHSSVGGGVYWMTKAEIVRAYECHPVT